MSAIVTVAHLIAKLQEFDPKAEVYVWAEDRMDYFPVREVYETPYRWVVID